MITCLLAIIEPGPFQSVAQSQRVAKCLKFNIPVKNFSVISGWSQWFLGLNELMCLSQEHQAPVGLKPFHSEFYSLLIQNLAHYH